MPANDNWANATDLMGAASGGLAHEDNTGATAETGEPGNYGRTLWYKFTAPVSGRWQFNTFGSAIRTTLGVWTGSAVTALTQVAFCARYAGWRPTSMVDFFALHNASYWIRVDGYNGDQGNIHLNWNRFYGLKFGNCSDCCQMTDAGYVYQASVTCTAPPGSATTAGSTTSFGTFAAGAYVARYCHGGFREGNSTGTQWVANRPPQWYTDYIQQTTGNVYAWFCAVSSNGGSGIPINVPLPPSISTASGGVISPGGTGEDYDSQKAVEYEERCGIACFWHAGGDISIKLQEWDSNDELPGSPWPTFNLYKAATPVALVKVTNGNMWDHTTTPHTYQATFNLRSLFCADLPGCAVTLKATGGVINPSSAHTGVTIPFSGFVPLTFQYQTKVTTADGTVLPDLSTDMTPFLVLSVQHFNPVNCGSNGIASQIEILINNVGNGVVDNLTAPVTILSNVVTLLVSCGIVSSPHTYQPLSTGGFQWLPGNNAFAAATILYVPSGSPSKLQVDLIDTGPTPAQSYPSSVLSL